MSLLELAQGCQAREENLPARTLRRAQGSAIWNWQEYCGARVTAINTTITMAPRTRTKEESRREVIDERPTVADLEGESSFATLAQKLWLNKKTAKVKVKHDVLKTEIWDVLEKEDFPFKSLLVLENLQILERCGCHFAPS
jgi:Intron-binding protein aquarius N-terminus